LASGSKPTLPRLLCAPAPQVAVNLLIAVFKENRFSTIATLRHVVRETGYLRAKRVMSANLTRTKTEGNRYRVDALRPAIGIYGLMAYSVAQRTQEMGIRMALGADRVTIRKMVVWHGMRLALIGVVLGIGAAFGLTRLLSTLLFGVKPWDPAVFVSAPFILTAIALLAVWLPAARASKVDPIQALRTE
jgi:FtsX-like permease family